MRGERGSVLLQVLILAAVASLMCAAVLRTRLEPSLISARAASRVQDDLAAQAAVNRVTEVWSRLGACATDSAAGVLCSGRGACERSCTVSSAEPDAAAAVVTAAPGGGACLLTAARE